MIKNNKLSETALRILIISIYPIWLMIILLECNNWEEYKELMMFPFVKWKQSFSSAKSHSTP